MELFWHINKGTILTNKIISKFVPEIIFGVYALAKRAHPCQRVTH
jgi:hypothetical protein